MTLTQFLGDSITHPIPLRWQGAAFEPGSDWLLIFTVKVDTADADDGAVIQKASGLGISVAGALASVAMVPQDTVDVTAKTLLWDIQAQHATTGEVRTVASGNLRLVRDITRLTETSIPIHTTEPPYPGGGNLAADTHAAASKETPADADEIPLVDSAAAWGLKKLTWAALKAALKTHFDTLYQAAGLTWATLSGKPTTFDPSAHKASHATGGADALTPADIGAQPAGSYAPATGISPAAITGTAVITTDFRLSNARTPTAHTHSAASIIGLGDLATLNSVSLTSQVTDTLPVEFGGTGANTADAARAALGIPEFSEEPTISTGAKRTADGALHATYFWAAGYPSSFGGFSTNGQVEFNGEDAGDSITFRMVNYFYDPAAALAHRTALGSGATGDALFQALTPAAARETLGVIRRETTTDFTSSSTSLVGAPELTFPVEAGKTYRVDLALVVSSLAAVQGVQVAMSYPPLGRTGFGWSQTQLHQTVKFPSLGASSVNLNPNTTGVPNAVTGLSGWVYLRPTSNGDVTFAAGQFSAGTGTVGLLAGSVITVTEL